MNRDEYEKLLLDHVRKTLVQEEQFGQWLRKFFFLNHELNKEYDTIYQDAFYIVFYDLVTVGLEYANKVYTYLKEGENTEKAEWYNELIIGLQKLKSAFSSVEFEFIEYKRHSASHIFQNHYENQILNKGRIQTMRKGKSIDKQKYEFMTILTKYGSDKDFDIYMTKSSYPIITDIYSQLKSITSQ